MTERETLVKRWIDWLRGDRFGQIDGQLGQNEPGKKPKRCCLGVACDVARTVRGTIKFKVGSDMNDYAVAYCGNEEQLLPATVCDMFGFRDASGEVYLPGDGDYWYEYELANLNDDGFTFDQIADIIEAGYVGSAAYKMATAGNQKVSETSWFPHMHT